MKINELLDCQIKQTKPEKSEIDKLKKETEKLIMGLEKAIKKRKGG